MNILGILSFEDNYAHLAGMAATRPIGAVSFLGRYRILDFMISNFTNSGISEIDIFAKDKPRSIIQHVHRTNYNINSKKGNVQILCGEQDTNNTIYNTDVASYLDNAHILERSNAEYVIIAPSHFIYTINFEEVLKEHINSESDITALYHHVENAREEFVGCDVLNIDDGLVKAMDVNYGQYKNRFIALESYILKRELFLKLCHEAKKNSPLFWFKDIVKLKLNELKVSAYQHYGYCCCINNIKAYYNASMYLRDRQTIKQLFKKDWPIHTMTNDSCPTLYKGSGSAINSLVGNGCVIRGEIINSIIGRNVIVGENTVIKDSIILPSSTIGNNCHIENSIIDRYVEVDKVKKLNGTKDNPIYVKRGDKI